MKINIQAPKFVLKTNMDIEVLVYSTHVMCRLKIVEVYAYLNKSTQLYIVLDRLLIYTYV